MIPSPEAIHHTPFTMACCQCPHNQSQAYLPPVIHPLHAVTFVHTRAVSPSSPTSSLLTATRQQAGAVVRVGNSLDIAKKHIRGAPGTAVILTLSRGWSTQEWSSPQVKMLRANEICVGVVGIILPSDTLIPPSDIIPPSNTLSQAQASLVESTTSRCAALLSC